MIQKYDYTIRKGTVEDALQIAQVHIKAWQESYIGLIDFSYLNQLNYEARLQKHEKRLQEHTVAYFVAIFEDQVIGFCSGAPFKIHSNQNISNPKELENVVKGEIDNLYILKQFHRQGLGKALFLQAVQWFKEHDLFPFVVWALADNLSARAFYKSQGGIISANAIASIGSKSYPEIAYIFNSVYF
ncbi:MAG: putative acetyltransferase [Chlamydiales bacterium]|jgi:GNAT superfamily N-acetyltransferase|nr:putative acetyltransferase [Chlamydiales bacterium]